MLLYFAFLLFFLGFAFSGNAFFLFSVSDVIFVQSGWWISGLQVLLFQGFEKIVRRSVLIFASTASIHEIRINDNLLKVKK